MKDKSAGKLAVEKMMQTYGCLPGAPDGPIIDAFTPEGLGLAIEQESNRAKKYGMAKITLHMDLPDALKLARFLRNKAKG